MGRLTIEHASDDAIVIRYKEEISPEVAGQVSLGRAAILDAGLNWITDVIPSYNELLVIYDQSAVDPFEAMSKIDRAVLMAAGIVKHEPKVIEIPVLYGGDFGPDIEYVANYSGLSIEDVISLHSSREYLIYMIGFTIGFPYLGGMDERLATPRLESPRQKVPRGSVGIAGKQTGIYSLDTPGGWQVIGRSPISLVNLEETPPAILSAGDYVKFNPISKAEYERLQQLPLGGSKQLRTYIKRGTAK